MQCAHASHSIRQFIAHLTNTPTNKPPSWSRVLLEKLTAPQTRNTPHCMAPGGSLRRSQEPATCPCPQHKINPVHASLPNFLKIHFNTILLYVPRFPKWLFMWGFSRQKICNASSVPVHAVYPAILYGVTIRGTKCEMQHWMGLKICFCLLISGAARRGLIEFCTKWMLMCMRT